VEVGMARSCCDDAAEVGSACCPLCLVDMESHLRSAASWLLFQPEVSAGA
jgi:hypothetical protein